VVKDEVASQTLFDTPPVGEWIRSASCVAAAM